MGTIYKRGRTYWIQYCKSGQIYRESSGSSKKMVANQLLKQREGILSMGKKPPVDFERVKFDDLVEFIRNDYKRNNKKIQDLDKRLKRLEPFFKGVSVPAITTETVENYIKDRLSLSCVKCGCKSDEETLEKGKCPFCKVGDDFEPGAENGTINRELAALKRMLNLGKQKDKVDRVPYVPMLKEVNVRKGFFEHPEFLALRDALPDYLKGLVTFAYKTGWRVSEITGLTWNQVDLSNGIVRLETGDTKNDEGRTVYLDDELRGVFNNQWKSRKKKRNVSPLCISKPQGNRTNQGF